MPWWHTTRKRLWCGGGKGLQDLAVLNWKWCHRTTRRINQQIMPQSQSEQNQINDSNLPLPHLDEIYYQGHSSPGKKKEQEVAQGNKEWAVRSEWSLVIWFISIIVLSWSCDYPYKLTIYLPPPPPPPLVRTPVSVHSSHTTHPLFHGSDRFIYLWGGCVCLFVYFTILPVIYCRPVAYYTIYSDSVNEKQINFCSFIIRKYLVFVWVEVS